MMPAESRATERASFRVESLRVLAAEPVTEEQSCSEFHVLVRHFFERFFAHELASAEGDSKTRLTQVACAMGIPGLVVTLYLYTPYHMPHAVRPFWAQTADHYFYVLYSFAAMGLLTLFEWDLFFPDLLDICVLSHLPVRNGQTFLARVTAIFLLLAAALFDCNILAFLVLPAAMDPPYLFRFWAAHAVAAGCAGIVGSTIFLGLEGLLLGLFGERFFRKLAPVLQGLAVMALLTALFSYPVVAGFLPHLVASPLACWFPPFWFLGIDQRLLEGSAAPEVFHALARIGFGATIVCCGAAAATYPIAWLRRTYGLVLGVPCRSGRSHTSIPLHGLIHHTVAREPQSRAIWHFITQNLLRVPRYRMVLVMAGGAGGALVLAAIARFGLKSGHLSFAFSSDGLRAVVPIIAFWTIAGLRSTFLAPADQRGRWVFRVTAGRPDVPQIRAARRWTLAAGLTLTGFATVCIALAEPSALTPHFVAGQLLVAVALSVLLTDIFFLNVKTIPFTGAKPNAAANFALLLIPYLGFFPFVVVFTVALEPQLEASWSRLFGVVAVCCAGHLILSFVQRSRLADHLRQIEADEDEEDFPLRLGLRY